MYENKLCLWCSTLLIMVTNVNPAAAQGTQAVALDKDPHLAGWWKFDESAGMTATDSSRHRRTGALTGGLSFDKNSTEGKVGKALRLNGSDAYIEIKGYKGVAGTRMRTVMAWVKTDKSRGEILSWGERDFGKMWTFKFIRGRLGVTPHGGYYYMNPMIHDNTWHHVAVVLEEAELPNLHDDVVLHLDGEIAEVHDIGLLDLWPVETGTALNLSIGKGFTGLIDDVRIYDRALSEEEIKVLFKLKSDRPMEKP
jgi:hypothetical protein